ncbi:tRNA lysidine(34) synthetase TilS [bacterium]|nr:tRNA lysidine(34) synthetase TilS [bacterium]
MRHALAILLGTVQRTIREQALLTPGDRVLVAVSGGSDSIGLLLALRELRRKLGIELVAAHVHHGLRGAAADADEAAAAAAAATLGVRFARCDLGGRLTVAMPNLEARARALRYAALHRLAAAHECTRIATGHTVDDQAETVLMRLLRGAGVRGLGAIRPRRRDGVVRPLLECRRADVRAVVEQAGLAYRHDASNDDPRFLRTQVRQRVLPLLGELNPAIAEACANLAASARAERAVVARWADAELASVAGDGGLPVAWLAGQGAGARAVLARRWLLRAGVPRRRLQRRHIRAAVALALAPEGRGEIHLPLGWTVRRRRGRLVAARRKSSSGRGVRAAEKPL